MMKMSTDPIYKVEVGIGPLVNGTRRVVCNGKFGNAVRGPSGYTVTMDDGTFVAHNTTLAGVRNFLPPYYNRNEAVLVEA